MKQSQENEPNPKLEEMVKRSIEIGRDIAKQAQEMDKSLLTFHSSGHTNGEKIKALSS